MVFSFVGVPWMAALSPEAGELSPRPTAGAFTTKQLEHPQPL